MILHHVARTVVPAAQVGAQLVRRGAQVVGNRHSEVRELAHTGFQVEHGQFGAPGQHFGIQAAKQMVFGLLAQLGTQLVGARLAHQLVIGSVVSRLGLRPLINGFIRGCGF